MKKSIKHLSLLLAILMLLTAVASVLTACGGSGDGKDTTETSGNGGTPTSDKRTVTIQSAGGLPLSGIAVDVRSSETNQSILTSPLTTDENGAVQYTAEDGNYYVVLNSVPQGYAYNEKYEVSGKNDTITLTSSVIKQEDGSFAEVAANTYGLGSVMHDFTFTDIEGNEFVLSELLEERRAVMLNFWYTTCTWCIQEFPVMNTAYQKYWDDMEILAINDYAGDEASDVSAFKEEYGLTMPTIKSEYKFFDAFDFEGAVGYPASVMIDRYGVICFMECGAILVDNGFENIFKYFTAEDYQQKLFTDVSELTPREHPDVEMPSSEEIGAVLNGNGFTAEYYPETSEDLVEYCWPFIITEKNGVSCIAPSNSGKNYSFAMMHATIHLKADEALAFDYIASTELNNDYLNVRIDDENMLQITGNSGTEWATAYPYVAAEEGDYKLTFWYVKDSSTSEGDDAVFMKNLRAVPSSEIDVPTYMPRNAASDPNEYGIYQSYVSLVFNESDGYYHVGDANGPLLLANFTSASLFNSGEKSLVEYISNGDLSSIEEALNEYWTYASNSKVSGYCTVNQELKELLEQVSQLIGYEKSENEWLQMCMYFAAFGTNGEQREDPIKGLSYQSAYEAHLGSDNVVSYDGQVLIPRGYLYRFTAPRSGVYCIYSTSDSVVEGWLFHEDPSVDTESYSWCPERMWTDTDNVRMYVYIEEGDSYYIDICYYDVYGEGDIPFTIEYVAETYRVLRYCSDGTFTTIDENHMDEFSLITGGLMSIQLGDDGYYREVYADGTVSSTILYADFTNYTPLFDTTVETMIERGAFDFTANGGQDYTEVMKGYLNGDTIILNSTETPELNGCVPVTEELAEILQLLVDAYSFDGVENAWTKMCCFYQHLGPDVPAAVPQH